MPDRRWRRAGPRGVDSLFDHDRGAISPSTEDLFGPPPRDSLDQGPSPLTTADLRDASVARLLTMRVRRHPAARIVARHDDLAAIELHCGGVSGLRLTTPEVTLFRKLAEPHDLFGALTDCGGAADYSSVFHRLVQLGVIVEA